LRIKTLFAQKKEQQTLYLNASGNLYEDIELFGTLDLMVLAPSIGLFQRNEFILSVQFLGNTIKSTITSVLVKILS